MARDWIATLYLFNSALFFTHEVDSAFWREWELFRLPGGPTAFLAANLLLSVLVLFGLKSVMLRKSSRRAWAIVLGSGGIVAGLLHGIFLAAGSPQFRASSSIGLLGIWLGLSIVQVVLAVRNRT